jgi:hypothetical protein
MVLGLTTTLNYMLLSRPAIRSIDELRDRHARRPTVMATYLALDHASLHPQRDQIVLVQISPGTRKSSRMVIEQLYPPPSLLDERNRWPADNDLRKAR